MSQNQPSSLHGSIPALLTPFKGGRIDFDSFAELTERQITGGSSAVVVCGTTGEAESLTESEHAELIAQCVRVSAGRVPVIAGAGSNATAHAVALARSAEKAGADLLLVLLPYYVKPSPEGQFQHFKAVHDATGLPIIIYNNPGRAAVDMQPDTMARLAALPRIIGVKDATADLSRPILFSNICDKPFCQLSGDDATALAFLSQGGQGCISVTANIAPRMCAQMQSTWRSGDVAKALEIQRQLMPLHKVLFIETSPAPLKHAMAFRGLCTGELRLPLSGVTDASKRLIESVIQKVDPE